MHPKQWADKIVPSFSEMTQISVHYKGSSFTRCECLTLALTTYLPAITLRRTEVTNPDIILLNASSLELLFGVEAGLLRGQPR